MTTLFLNTSASLPKTSYFKMIDIWMVFGLLLPFLEVVLHTVTEYQRRETGSSSDSDEGPSSPPNAVATVASAAASSSRGKGRDLVVRIRDGKVVSATRESGEDDVDGEEEEEEGEGDGGEHDIL